MKTSTMIIAVGAVALAAYFLFRDKLPSLPGIVGGALAGLPSAATVMLGADPQTIKETGAVGGVGDLIYGLTYGGDLRKEATMPGGKYYEAAKQEIPRVTGITPTPKQIVPRAVAMGASTKIHELGMPLSMVVAPVTIGAGMGAITQQARYRETLPPEAAEKALVQEYATRQEWITEHPVESMVGFPAGIIHAVTTPVPQTDFFSTLARGWGRIFG
jgi:hypothetical protein